MRNRQARRVKGHVRVGRFCLRNHARGDGAHDGNSNANDTRNPKLIVEYIFDYPGFGRLTVQAVLQRDFPVIQGIAIISTSIFVVINILVDFISAQIDPRIDY